MTLVANGADAVEACRRQRFDVVLMDVQMPVLDGLTATRAIRDWERTKGLAATPIIAMTAHALEGDRDRCLDSGMDNYVSKPIKAKELWRAMGRA